MPIRVVCPSCQTPAQVPDSAAGSRGRCRRCGALVRVPGAPVRCVRCHVELDPRRAQRDPQGQPHCPTCWQADLAQLRQQIIQTAQTAAMVPYRQNGFCFDYPTGWTVRRMDVRTHSGGVRLCAPSVAGGAEAQGLLCEVLLETLNAPAAQILDRLIESTLLRLRQSKPQFAFRERISTRQHLAWGRGIEAIYLSLGGFEYDCQPTRLPLRERVLLLGQTPAFLAITATARRDLWEAYQPALGRIIDAIRLPALGLSTPTKQAV